MKEFLSVLCEYRFIIGLILTTVLYAVCEWEKFKAQAYKVMLMAKKMAKDKVLNSGKEQEDWVVQQLMIIRPRKCSFFLTEEVVRKIVHWLYGRAKDLIDDGKLNGSI